MDLEQMFPTQQNAPMLARREIGRILRETVPDDRFDDLQLAVSELVTNAVINGRLSGQEAISVSVGVDDAHEVLRVTVEQPVRRHPSRTRRAATPPMFASTVLLDSVTDRWGIALGPPARAWFELDLGTDA